MENQNYSQHQENDLNDPNRNYKNSNDVVGNTDPNRADEYVGRDDTRRDDYTKEESVTDDQIDDLYLEDDDGLEEEDVDE